MPVHVILWWYRLIVQRSNELSSEIKELDSDMQMLVYENYNKFIVATDTIQQMKQKVCAHVCVRGCVHICFCECLCVCAYVSAHEWKVAFERMHRYICAHVHIELARQMRASESFLSFVTLFVWCWSVFHTMTILLLSWLFNASWLVDASWLFDASCLDLWK